MLFYYGVELLHKLQTYYTPRLQTALSRGFDAEEHKYHWLYTELCLRVQVLQQSMLFLNALPQFMKEDDTDSAFRYVISYASDWFRNGAIGETPKEDDAKSPFYADDNPYWADVNEALEHFDRDYKVKLLPMLYVDLCEYVVRCVRFLFHIREHCVHAIDKDKFDALMQRVEFLPSIA
jgi:hypothetical protein